MSEGTPRLFLQARVHPAETNGGDPRGISVAGVA